MTPTSAASSIMGLGYSLLIKATNGNSLVSNIYSCFHGKLKKA